MSAPDSLEDFISQIFPEGHDQLRLKRERKAAILKRLTSVNERIECLSSSDEVQAIFSEITALIAIVMLEMER